MGEATTDLLTAAQNLLVVVSTYGEGEMPDDAEDFWLEVAGDSAPRLEDLRYAVCGLGDLDLRRLLPGGQELRRPPPRTRRDAGRRAGRVRRRLPEARR